MPQRATVPSRIPIYGRALLDALQFTKSDCAQLQAMEDVDWQKLLDLADTVQLTLTLRHFARDAMPAWVRNRVDRNASNNAVRFAKASSMLLEIAAEFEAKGIDYAVLKGFTHSPHFTPDASLRAQTDCDLWVGLDSLSAANRALTEMGFAPACESSGRHLPPMVRPSEWSWTGDYFAVDLPISVDLHYELWDAAMEKVAGPDESEFWDRRVKLDFNGKSISALCEEDMLGFAALHLLMHLFHGDLRLHRAWEIAHFLHHRANDRDFWRSWQILHPQKLRSLQAIVFGLVKEWFSCDTAPEAEAEISLLSNPVRRWIELLGWSPVVGLFEPNRDELWLRLALIESGFDRTRMFLYRLLPLRKGNQLNLTAGRFAFKAVRHMRSLFPTLTSGIGWWWSTKGISKDFLTYLAGAALFDAGAFIFVLLYNLLLFDQGFHARLIGQVNGCMTAGTLAASIPAAWMCRRYGLRNALLIAVVGSGLAAMLRTAADEPSTLMATAFLHGTFFSMWAVCFSPTVAAFTNERSRTFGFSLTCGMGMSLGIAAAYIGGRLPGMFQFMGARYGPTGMKRLALFTAASVILLAAIPISRLIPSAQPDPESSKASKRIYPRTFFFIAFLVVSCIWSLATGAFNPFFNTYFAESYHMTVEKIGSIFSLSQFVQVIAVFLAPAILRWLGEIKGIAVIQLLAAFMMALLALHLPSPASAAIFIGYMAFQYMTLPSLFSLITSHVASEEQSGASALNFLVTSMAGVAASFAAGAIIDQRGYAQLLTGSAALAVLASILTWTLLPAHGGSARFAELSEPV